jgi:CspA family cold shock protein
MTGSIKKLTDKGFGFITAEGLAKDLFFHSNSLVGVQFDELREGDAVTFDTEETAKGPSAVNVQRA